MEKEKILMEKEKILMEKTMNLDSKNLGTFDAAACSGKFEIIEPGHRPYPGICKWR
jgi:hypothetical protein